MAKEGVLEKDFTVTHPDPLDPDSGFLVEAQAYLLDYYHLSSERARLLRPYRMFHVS